MSRRRKKPPEPTTPERREAMIAAGAREVPQVVTRRADLEGRPWWVLEEGIALVERLSREGASYAATAAALGISERSFRDVRKRQPEVEAAYERGHYGLEAELVSGLVQQARAGEVVPSLFLLKTLFGYREGVERDGAGPAVAVQITLPGPAPTMRQYLDVLEQPPEAQPSPEQETDHDDPTDPA